MHLRGSTSKSPTNDDVLVKVYIILNLAAPFRTATYESLSMSEVPGTLGLSSCPFRHVLVSCRLSKRDLTTGDSPEFLDRSGLWRGSRRSAWLFGDEFEMSLVWVPVNITRIQSSHLVYIPEPRTQPHKLSCVVWVFLSREQGFCGMINYFQCTGQPTR